MNDDAHDARHKLDELNGKTLTEAAQTYLLGVLQVDVPEDLHDLWQTSFEDEQQRRDVEAALARLGDDDRQVLLEVAMHATVDDRPETATLLTEAVEQAGQSLFVVEIAMLTMAAALLLRERHAKGRTKERRNKMIIEPGRITIEEWQTEWDPNGKFAEALTKLLPRVGS
jgi:hypothetical protein